MPHRIADIFKQINGALAEGHALVVTAPADGRPIARLSVDTPESVDEKIWRARAAQQKWELLNRGERAALIERLAGAIKTHREPLAELVHLEGGKSMKESLGEADGSETVLLRTIKEATLPDLGNMARVKERPPVGVVGLITSFNFPLAVAHWTIAPALLAANGVVWKPSEKTPLVALATKAVFDGVMGAHAGLLQVIIGAHDVGRALVAHEQVDMISATGSVGMGKAIKAALSEKTNNAIPPILELGGNNGVIISDKMSQEHLAWSLSALMNSFLGSTGQRCTNTRRLIVHKSLFDDAARILKENIETFLPMADKSDNEYGYGPLIDDDALSRFENAKQQAVKEGGKIVLGGRRDKKGGCYVEPALALMPSQTAIMHQETFAPILFIAPYADFSEALSMLNAPDNAGLVGAIYTQSQGEADQFAAACEAGHALINPPKGTGTPAHGMGFGGNKDSGEGEILNAADPLLPFTRRDRFTRIARNKDIKMSS